MPLEIHPLIFFKKSKQVCSELPAAEVFLKKELWAVPLFGSFDVCSYGWFFYESPGCLTRAFALNLKP